MNFSDVSFKNALSATMSGGIRERAQGVPVAVKSIYSVNDTRQLTALALHTVLS